MSEPKMRELLTAMLVAECVIGEGLAKDLGQYDRYWFVEVWMPILDAGYVLPDKSQYWKPSEAGINFIKGDNHVGNI